MRFIHEKIDLGYETLDRAEHSDGRRYLTLDGVAYPSVTTVLSILGEEKIAFDIANYRKAKSGIRIWNGSNIKKNDLIALTNWLDWSFNYFRL